MDEHSKSDKAPAAGAEAKNNDDTSARPAPQANTGIDSQDGPEELSWLVARHRNAAECPLFQLPYDIIPLLYARMDEQTKRILRQTCSYFAESVTLDIRLVRDWATVQSRQHNGRVSWPVYRLPYSVEETAKLAKLVRRDCDGFCAGCRAFRQDGRFSAALLNLHFNRNGWLWCCLCEAGLSPLMFSGAQRKVYTPDTRVCIGHEARMALCSHKTLSWGGFSRAINNVVHAGIGCSDAQHQHPSRCGPLVTAQGVPAPMLLPYASVKSRNHLNAKWEAHIFDHDPNDPDQPPLMRAKVAEHLARALQPAANPGEQGGSLTTVRICPHVLSGNPLNLLMLPFERGQCACFDAVEPPVPPNEEMPPCYTGAYHNHTKGLLGKKPAPKPCCRCDAVANAAKCEARRETHQPHAFISDGEYVNRSAEEPTSMHQYSCRECPSIYSWKRYSTGCVYLRCDWKVALPRIGLRPSHREWLSVVEPASWNVAKDNEETHRLTWCEDPDCKTTSSWYKLATMDELEDAGG